MTMNLKLTIALTLLMGLFNSFEASAQAKRAVRASKNGWTMIGNKNVDWKPERDVIRVGIDEGGFKKLKVKVTGGTVYMSSMTVTYGNGVVDNIPLKHVFTKGAESRIIDLQGGKRVIKKITFVYDRKNTARNAQVWVAGKKI